MKIFVDTNISRNKKDFELSTLPVYTAEEYNQNYYKTHFMRYKFYKCGRDKQLKSLWGKA